MDVSSTKHLVDFITENIEISISDLGLSPRIYHSLHQRSIDTLSKLQSLSRQQLIENKIVGVTAMRELTRVLKDNYVHLAGDNSVSDEEEAVIEEIITPIVDAEIATEDMLAEVTLIKETKPFTFSHLKKYLAHVNVEALDEFGTLVERVIVASDGVSTAEKDAKAKFEEYLIDRRKA